MGDNDSQYVMQPQTRTPTRTQKIVNKLSDQYTTYKSVVPQEQFLYFQEKISRLVAEENAIEDITKQTSYTTGREGEGSLNWKPPSYLYENAFPTAPKESTYSTLMNTYFGDFNRLSAEVDSKSLEWNTKYGKKAEEEKKRKEDEEKRTIEERSKQTNPNTAVAGVYIENRPETLMETINDLFGIPNDPREGHSQYEEFFSVISDMLAPVVDFFLLFFNGATGLHVTRRLLKWFAIIVIVGWGATLVIPEAMILFRALKG
jgi:hypothetical protein